MDFKALDKKWNDYWKKHTLHSFDKSKTDKKMYVMEMLPYPSGSNLHLGHWFNYGPSDSYARFKKMQGYEVFQPMGFDAFGLPAENYAIKTGIHPYDSTMKNIQTMERQFDEIGAMFNFDAELYTCSPDYYRWTQWLFLKLYEKGLAYQKNAPVNWCSSCKTVIANEQVVDGVCERCGTQIVKKEMTQWFFKITDYAEELLKDLDGLDWPEKTKIMQKNWIGKSTGGEIVFPCENGKDEIRVFTTRADTVHGVSYVVLAPEHPLVDKITTKAQKKAVEAYKIETSKSNEIERLSSAKEKTGVFTGAYCINPLTSSKIPVYIADYCLLSYGTGAVMAVPAHDTRDYDFAVKYKLPINRVIKSKDGKNDELPYTEYGVLINSNEFNGLGSKEAIKQILIKLEGLGKGGFKTNYRLRDWSVSRQRYWGAPIPMIHCPHCGAVPVPEKDLPVTLPYDVNFTPDGGSPLRKSEEFMNVTCPVCGAPAQRDPDTLDTFVCSSWYYLRYPDNKNDKAAFDPEIINKMLPVDKYIGGAEHACMHLLYSRFITKALRDMGYLKFSEPFKSLVHQGLILGPDGNKMSKSKGNVVNPDQYTGSYGSDIFRLYLMFGFAFTEGGPWNDDGIKAVYKFAERVERIVTKYAEMKVAPSDKADSKDDKELEYALNYCIKCVTADMEHFSFNTAIARIMELVNALYKYDSLPAKNDAFARYVIETLVKILAPFTPHIAEEFNAMLGGKKSIFLSRFPVCDEKKLVKDEVEIAVQINSKVRARITIPSNADDKAIEKIALADEKVIAALEGKPVRKVIVIKGRLVNLVV